MKITHKTIKLLLLALLIACNPKPSISIDDLKGSWFFFFDGIYFELYITGTYFIYHSELLGTQIKNYSVAKNGSIEIFLSENDPNPVTISIISLAGNKAIIEQDFRELSLQKMNLDKIDLSKLLEFDSQYYKDFIKGFQKRMQKMKSEMETV